MGILDAILCKYNNMLKIVIPPSMGLTKIPNKFEQFF